MSHGEMMWTSGLIPMIEPDVVTEIISRISDLALVVSRKGQVLGIMTNPNFMSHADFVPWEGKPLTDQLSIESVPKFEKRLADFTASDGTVLPVEVNQRVSEGSPDFPMRYSFHRIGSDGNILMLGRDLRPIAEMQQQLVSAQIALEKDYESQREFDTRFRVLMASSSEITLFVSAASGIITDANAVAANFFGTTRNDLIGSRLANQLDAKSDGELMTKLVEAASKQSPASVTLSVRQHGEMVIKPTLFRSGGEQVLLCRVAPNEASKLGSDGLQTNLAAMYQSGVDAMVFVDAQGFVLSANEAFLNMADVTHTMSVKGRPLSDFLGRGSVDLNVLLENASRSGSMRLYATRLISEHGAERSVEISTSKLSADTTPVFSLIIRDASRVDAIRTPQAQVTDVDMRSVIELIGSQTLKDIVAKTTDVVEKMCIETAVELTSNNRVAAAEMLGLSRQSLYVKLRKYDLL